MLAILNSLNAHKLPIFQSILVILVSKFVDHRSLSNILIIGLLSPLRHNNFILIWVSIYSIKSYRK